MQTPAGKIAGGYPGAGGGANWSPGMSPGMEGEFDHIGMITDLLDDF
jgi:hypothetical protein